MRIFNVVYPSYCDTTVDLCMQARELMKSSRIAGFCTFFFCKMLWGGPPDPPLNTIVNLITIKVAYTSGQFFEKIMKRYSIFSLQINYDQIDQRHKLNILSVKFYLNSFKN